MLVSFQTAMPVLLAVLTTWLLVEWSVRIRVTPVFVAEFNVTLSSQPGQIFRPTPIGQMHLREARRGSPDVALPDVRMGGMPAHARRLH